MANWRELEGEKYEPTEEKSIGIYEHTDANGKPIKLGVRVATRDDYGLKLGSVVALHPNPVRRDRVLVRWDGKAIAVEAVSHSLSVWVE